MAFRSSFATTLAGMALTAALGFVAPVEAQSGKKASQPTAADRDTARELVAKGNDLLEAGNAAAALDAYKAAHAIMRVPTTGVKLAKALEALSRFVEARDAAIEVMRYPESSNEPKAFRQARVDAESMAERLGKRIPTLLVKVSGPPTDARPEVHVDDVLIPVEALGSPRRLDPGKHVVKASAPGFGEATREVSLREAETRTIELTLKKQAGATPPMAPTRPEKPPAPERTPPEKSGWPTLAYVGFGIGAAGVAVGSVTGYLTIRKVSASKEHCDGSKCAEAARDDLDAAKRFGMISNVAFAVGAIGIGVGAVALWTRPTHEGPRDSGALRLRILPTSGGASARIELDSPW